MNRGEIMNDLTVEEMRNVLLATDLPPADNLRRLEEIDALTGLLEARDLERLQAVREKFLATIPPEPDGLKLSKYQKFVKYAEDVYCYILAKYNSRTRAAKVASVFLGMPLAPVEIEQWASFDESLSARCKAAVEEFRDRLREEIFRRAVEGEDKEIYDKEGNHITTVKIKNDKLLEKILSANCEEYKDRTPTGVLSAGNIVFNVMNFSTEVEEIMEAEVVDKDGGGN